MKSDFIKTLTGNLTVKTVFHMANELRVKPFVVVQSAQVYQHLQDVWCPDNLRCGRRKQVDLLWVDKQK